MTVQDWPEPTAPRPDDYVLNGMLRGQWRATPTDAARVPDAHVLASEAGPHDCQCECGECAGGSGCSGNECQCECGTCLNDDACGGHDCNCPDCEKGTCYGCNGEHCPGCEGQPEENECECSMCTGDHRSGLAMITTDGCVIAGSDPDGRCSHGHATWLRYYRMA